MHNKQRGIFIGGLFAAVVLVSTSCGSATPPPTATLTPTFQINVSPTPTVVETATVAAIPWPTSEGPVSREQNPIGKDTDVKQLAKDGKLSGGRPDIGQQKYIAFSCVTCHTQGQVAPITAGTFTRIVNERLKDAANAGKSPEEFIAESIIRPNAYVAPGFSPNVMPQDWGTKLDLTDIKDLIAFIETQK